MRILLTGQNGQVGYELERVLSVLGDVIATDRSRLDLAVPDAIRRVVREAKPDLIVNAAAQVPLAPPRSASRNMCHQHRPPPCRHQCIIRGQFRHFASL